MHTIRKQLNKHKLIKILSSIKITVTCLCLLFILTLWGTIDQINNGLYLAQVRFFHSWGFTFWGFIPFPGARLVLWVLFINLVTVSCVRFVFSWSKIGITVIHFGILTFFVAAFVTFHSVEESNMMLMEGEGSNVASAYHNWELSVWTQEGDKSQVVAFDADHLQRHDELNFEKHGLIVTVESYFANSDAYRESAEGQTEIYLSRSGIQSLKPKSINQAPEKNFPGGIFLLKGADQGNVRILLFGGERKPLAVNKGGEEYFIQLRRKRFVLPFTIHLKEFTMEKHPNTEVARSYESLVDVIAHGVSREVLISMNEPLRHKNYTLYQASYSIDAMGREYSTLAVVKNTGRLLPYIATFTTFAGLVIHFLMMAFRSKKRRKK